MAKVSSVVKVFKHILEHRYQVLETVLGDSRTEMTYLEGSIIGSPIILKQHVTICFISRRKLFVF